MKCLYEVCIVCSFSGMILQTKVKCQQVESIVYHLQQFISVNVFLSAPVAFGKSKATCEKHVPLSDVNTIDLTWSTVNWACLSPLVTFITSLFCEHWKTIAPSNTHGHVLWNALYNSMWLKIQLRSFSTLVTHTQSYTSPCRHKNVDTLRLFLSRSLTNCGGEWGQIARRHHTSVWPDPSKERRLRASRQALGQASTGRLRGKSSSGWPSHGFRDCWDHRGSDQMSG